MKITSAARLLAAVVAVIAAAPLLAGAPAGAANGAVTLITVTPPTTHGVAAGPDGNMWFTAEGPDGVGRITPAGVVTYFTDAQNEVDNPQAITVGPDGAMWFVNWDNNRIGRIDVTTGDITTFTNAGIATPVDIVTGPDNRLWFTNIGGSDTIGAMTTAGAFQFFNDDASMNNPKGLVVGPDGALWFTSGTPDRIGRITTSGSSTVFPVTGTDVLRDMTVGPDGNLWFTSANNEQVGRMTTAGVVTLFPAPQLQTLFGITTGPDGNLWVTGYGSDEVGRVTTSGVVTTFTTAGVFGPELIAPGPGGQNLYFGINAGGHVGRVTVGETSPFSDVPTSSQFFDDIKWMVDQGITTGFPGGTFRPAGNVTRASMAAFMYRLADEPAFTAPGTPSFNDVALSATFFKEIEWLVSEDITTGFPGNLYRPSAAVTRQSMSAFMYRLAGEPSFTPPGVASFNDVPTSSTFFKEIEWMVDEEITTGFPGDLFKPGASVTRQAMSAFMHRLADGPGVAP